MAESYIARVMAPELFRGTNDAHAPVGKTGVSQDFDQADWVVRITYIQPLKCLASSSWSVVLFA